MASPLCFSNAAGKQKDVLVAGFPSPCFTTASSPITGQMNLVSAIGENFQESKDVFYIAESAGHYT